MTAYYNENDPFAAAWLNELIRDGLIAPGIVDTRSIEDIIPTDLKGFTQCHFFAGIGVWSLSLRVAGWPDDRPVWTGSCPCQPFSEAGKGNGFVDERHLWPAWFHVIARGKRPDVPVLGEQVASKAGRNWFDLVSSDMEALDHACGAVDISAAGFGAPHTRQRIFWLASHTDSNGVSGQKLPRNLGENRQRWSLGPMDLQAILDSPFTSGTRFPQPIIRSMDDGWRLPHMPEQVRAAGNALNVSQTQAFIEAVMGYLDQ